MECGLDLHAKMVNETEQDGFGNLEVSERDMWLNNTTNNHHDHDHDDDVILGMNMNMNDDDASMFYVDFPPLPDFPCMSSSSSSSSSSVPPLKTIACTSTTTTTTSSSSSASSSSAASWAILKSDLDEVHGEKINSTQNGYMHHPLDHHGQHATTLSSTASMEISQQQQDLGVSDNNHVVVGGGDCMDDDGIMDTFGYMELLEANDFFDPASIFQNDEENPLVDFTQEQQVQVQDEYHHHHQQVPMIMHDDSETKLQEQENNDVFVCDVTNNEEENNFLQGCVDDGVVNDEMSSVFLEWLKSNKDSVSANDLRNVKLKKSTIESAASRLGGGKEGMKRLLKLILEWVQTSHLQNKRLKEDTTLASNLAPQTQQFQDPCQNQNTTNTFAPVESNACFNQWLDQTQPLIVPPQQFSQPVVGVGYVGDPYNTNGSVSNNFNPYQPAATNEYHHMLESNQSWGASQFNVASNYNQSFVENNNSNMIQPHGVSFGGYGNQYNSYQFFHGPGDRLMRLGPSATKEARKKRMARQRRFISHHRHQNNNDNQNFQGSDSLARLGSGDSCTNVVGAGSHANPANWMYWQTMPGGAAASLAPVAPVEPTQPLVDRDRHTMHTQNSHQGRNASDKRQGWKPEKNLRFLLQKVLKQSDVGSLGRIVLPKKEAETHLPQLEARDGISITMEDIGTSRVWNMRYRYWPNNKSRMYLLENTGDFVKANGLQEGDFIVIYSDVKCGKFMIRGVKVRQQQGAKPEAKKAGKSQKNQHGNNSAIPAGNAAVDNNGTSSSPKRKK
ncbi:B3 domain-containing transcription factor ABI3 [Trifolium pratense]|uniref:B3 domain-containing transcription factor ABI3 n=1 Tax=Trifolium pratense TaxID=57577 RepID=UPI001E69591C|nr:B3 domain-containing transcription factor ABI3 [Trifolium pratense]